MKKNKGHAPIRTCLSCGTRQSKKRLIRLILNTQGLLVRDDGKSQGRGAYVCPDRGCWEDLQNNKNLGRAFRKEGPIIFHSGLRFE